MNKKLLIFSAVFPLWARAETTKEKVERKRELLVSSIRSQADEVTRRIVARIPEIQKRIEIQKELCFDNRDCAAAMAGYSEALEVMRTGKYMPNPSNNKAISQAIGENSSQITPENAIAKGLRNDLDTLTVVKNAFDGDSSDITMTLDQGNIVDSFVIASATQSKTPSAEFCLLLKQQSFETLRKKMLKDTKLDTPWEDLSEKERENLSKAVFTMWLTAPEVYADTLEWFGRNSFSLKEGILSAIDTKKELSDSLTTVDDKLKLLGVDPDSDKNKTSSGEKKKTAAELAREAAEKRKQAYQKNK